MSFEPAYPPARPSFAWSGWGGLPLPDLASLGQAVGGEGRKLEKQTVGKIVSSAQSK